MILCKPVCTVNCRSAMINSYVATRTLFRCTLTKRTYKFEGIALSEISLWGNRMGPWEVFKNQQNGRFVYVGTEYLTDIACLERCRSKGYLTSGRCNCERG